jgi:hypothetical protein
MAVGEVYNTHLYPTLGGEGPALFERWNGKVWSVLPGNSEPGPRVQLNGISCTAPTFCMATGTSLEGPFIPVFDSWNGKLWTYVPGATGQPTGAPEMAAVSCTGVSQCVAVGFSGSSTINADLLEAWDGTTWSLPTVPDDASGLGVSCPSPSQCVAVGFSFPPQEQAIADGWNGSDWALQDTPTFPGDLSQLKAVSCWAVGSCMAVGLYQALGGIQFTLSEVLEDNDWQVFPTPTG